MAVEPRPPLESWSGLVRLLAEHHGAQWGSAMLRLVQVGTVTIIVTIAVT